MTTLLIDAGNTRLKWAFLRDGRLGRQQAIAHRDGDPAPSAVFAQRRWQLLTARWRNARERRHAPLREVIVVSVAGPRFDAALRAWLRGELGLPLRFVASQRSAAGVRNGYRDPWRLGADRWVALLGAHALLPHRAACVVDAGTAITIDLLDARGRHRGGAIVPGPQLMQQSLLRGTGGIRRRAAGGGSGGGSLFARDTRSALRAGAGHAAAAVIERALVEARAVLRERPVLVLTGGAARALRPLLAGPTRLVPDLVLRGLAELAAG